MGAQAMALVLARPFHPDALETVAAVQTAALGRGLPLAVVATIDTDTHPMEFAILETIESELKGKNIPLMALVGPPEKTLPAFIYHTNADLRFQGDETRRGKLKRHTFQWPGTVQSVAVVRAYVASLQQGTQELCI